MFHYNYYILNGTFYSGIRTTNKMKNYMVRKYEK